MRSKNYTITDRQKNNCGYDLLAKRKKPSSELHIEVKGTSGDRMRFYISRNEYMYMPNPRWRLLMVTTALSGPKINIMTENEVENIFEFRALSYEAILK